jgi:aldose 1-epimerase
VPVPERLDFRRPRPLAGVVLDDAFVDAVYRDGRSWTLLTGADGGTAAAWTDGSMTCWQLCSGEDVAVPGYARAGLAAEPMTCVADAFNTGDRLVRLPPGGEHTVRWGLALL